MSSLSFRSPRLSIDITCSVLDKKNGRIKRILPELVETFREKLREYRGHFQTTTELLLARCSTERADEQTDLPGKHIAVDRR